MIPKHYLIIDTETTGLPDRSKADPFADIHITQLGWLKVYDSKPVSAGVKTFCLPEGVEVHPRAAEVTGIDTAKANAEGVDPHDPLLDMVMLIKSTTRLGGAIVGHNLIGFDAHVINVNLMRYRLEPIIWENLNVIDTGAIFKGEQIGYAPGEVIKDFATQHEVLSRRIYGLHWNLDLACKARGVEMTREAHQADEDCMMTHCLLEKYREA